MIFLILNYYFFFFFSELEDTLVQERQEYEDLTNRYDILEGEHVDIKASLVKEKENNHG